MIRIKDQDVLTGLMMVPFASQLIDVLCWVDWYWPEEVVITSGFRPGDAGVHGQDPCRGVDLRSRAFRMHPGYVESKINEHWEYDPERPGKYTVCFYHDTGSGFHFHLQSHPNTRRLDVA